MRIIKNNWYMWKVWNESKEMKGGLKKIYFLGNALKILLFYPADAWKYVKEICNNDFFEIDELNEIRRRYRGHDAVIADIGDNIGNYMVFFVENFSENYDRIEKLLNSLGYKKEEQLDETNHIFLKAE